MKFLKSIKNILSVPIRNHGRKTSVSIRNRKPSYAEIHAREVRQYATPHPHHGSPVVAVFDDWIE